MTGALSWWHWVVVLIVIVILFGSKKLPEAARGLGRSMRIFKSEIKEMQNENSEEPTRELTERPADPAPTAETDPDRARKSA